MATLSDVKAAFYDAQRNASNAFELIYADLDRIFKDIQKLEEEKKKNEKPPEPEA